MDYRRHAQPFPVAKATTADPLSQMAMSLRQIKENLDAQAFKAAEARVDAATNEFLAKPIHSTLGHFLRDVHLLAVGAPGSPEWTDARDRLETHDRFVKRGIPAGASEQVPADGGHLVAPTFANAIVERMYSTGQVLQRCTNVAVDSSAFKFPQFAETSRANGSRFGGVRSYWQNEADLAVSSKPAFAVGELSMKKLIGLLYLTDELSMDSNAFSTWSELAFSSELAFRLEASIISGDGAGKPMGVIAAPATIVVAKDAGQLTGTVTADNVTQMSSRLWSASRPNSIWLFNQALRPALSTLALPVGSGGSFVPLWHCSEGQPYLDCIPAFESEYCSAPGALGDLILVDLSRTLVGIRSTTADVSIHVRFSTSEQAFRYVMRVDAAPLDIAPVVPLNGTVTTSSAVVLAARP
jgi:HK97 family phage major capsid protein